MNSSPAKLALRLLQWGLLLAIVVYLVLDIRRNRSFAELWSEPKRWDLLAAAAAITLGGVVVTIVRWHWLNRALDLPLNLRDALRLGFVGYLLNFVSVGSVGGDLFKAVLTARRCPGRRTEAVASVVVDRLIGLYAVFLLASAAIFATGLWRSGGSSELRAICRATWIATAVATLLVAALFLPDISGGRFARLISRAPKVGRILERLLHAARVYRSRPGVLLAALVASLLAQTMFACAYYLVASGLVDRHPSLLSHLVIVPLVAVFGVIPMPAGGLGAVELVMDFLYRQVTKASEGFELPTKNLGVMVSLGYRVVSLVVALVGVCYYMAARREVAAVMYEVQADHVDTLLDAADDPEAPGKEP